MPQDHFVAQTYLKQFLDPAGGPMRGYRKTTLANFPCWPKDVCRELDGDIIPDFLSNPQQLGQYRSLFEPHWANAVGALNGGDTDREVKLAIAGYIANLMVCTPGMTRNFVEASDHQHVTRLTEDVVLRDENGLPVEPNIRKAVEWLAEGKIVLNTEPDFIRAMLARQLMQHAWHLFDGEWTVIRNTTPIDFLTSDNPAAFEDPGPFHGGHSRLPRYIPLTPRLCVLVNMEPPLERRAEPDFTQQPKGRIRFATTSERHIRVINEAIVQCAEDLVISSKPSAQAEALVTKFAAYRVSNEFIDLRMPDRSFLNGQRLRVWDPATNAAIWSFAPRAA